MRRSRALLATWVLMLAGGLTACGADGAEPTSPTESPGQTSPATTGVTPTLPTESPGQTSPVTSSPGKSIPLIGGGSFDTAAFGTGPLALWFWAPG